MDPTFADRQRRAGLSEDQRTRLLRTIEAHRQGEIRRCIDDYCAFLADNPGQFDALRLLGAALVSEGRYEEALHHLGHALSISQALPEVWILQGDACASLRRHWEAAASYQRALALNPSSVRTWASLGQQWHALGRHVEAVDCFQRVVSLEPASAQAHCNLAKALLDLDRPDDALASYESATRFQPQSLEAWRGCAACLTALGRLRDAVEACNQALRVAASNRPDPATNPTAELDLLRFNRGLLNLTLGDYPSGWEDYELRTSRMQAPSGIALWQAGESLEGRTILLLAEQGLGDTLQFVRFVPALTRVGARVIVRAPSSLHRILMSVAGISELIDIDADIRPGIDFALPLASLPQRLGVTLGGFPEFEAYLSVPDDLSEQWSARLRPKTAPRIGLAFSGNPAHSNDRNRSIPLERFAPLIQAGGEWHCLQNAVREQDELALRDLPIADHRQALTDLAETAALVKQMDVVLSVDTSLVHLAGALGAAPWVLLPFVPDWRWLQAGEQTPWYPRARLFRQPARSDWFSPLASVAKALARL
jgi:tetratricopeptide (TPR) repeat protein